MVHSNLRSKYTETLEMAKWHSSGLFSFIERLVKVLQAPEERGRSGYHTMAFNFLELNS